MKRLALLIACSALPLAAAALQATVRPAVVVSGGTVTLEDVAELSGDASELQRVRSVVVTSRPRADSPKRLTRAELARAVRPVVDASTVTWDGAEAVMVAVASTTVSGAQIADQAALYLYGLLSDERQRVVIRPVELPDDVVVASGAVALRPRPLAYSEALRRQARVWVDILVDGRFYRSVAVSFAVEVWRQAWTARSDLPLGQALHCDALEMRELRIEAVGEPFEGGCDAAGLRLRRPVRANEVVLAAAVEPTPALEQGRAMRLRARVGDVVVELPAKAMSDARIGQTIQVRSAVGGAVVRARVTAAGEASVSPQQGSL